MYTKNKAYCFTTAQEAQTLEMNSKKGKGHSCILRDHHQTRDKKKFDLPLINFTSNKLTSSTKNTVEEFKPKKHLFKHRCSGPTFSL